MTANNKKNIQVQIDRELNNEVEDIFKRLNLTPTMAITAFYNHVAANGGLPFDKELTAREVATLCFLRADKDIPVHKIMTKKDLDEWIAEDW